MRKYSLPVRIKKSIFRLLPRDRNPNFFIIGAGKSATTSMYNYLGEHPNIFFPTVKEPAYFAFSDLAGSHYNDEDKPWVEQCFIEIEAYSALFRNVADESVVAEATPIYLYHPNSAKAIYTQHPKSKLLAILRNPYERAYSDYRMHVRQGKETRSFTDSLKEDYGKYRLYVGSYLEKSLYGEQVERYYKYFDKDQLKIVLYSDLAMDAAKVISEVFEFLDVQRNYQIDTTRLHNASKNTVTSVPEEAYEYMKPYFEKDIALLEQLTNLNLSSWKASPN